MKKLWTLACIAGGMAATFVGCDSSAGAGSSSNSNAILAGKAAFDSADVQVVDSSGTVVARGKVGKGEFQIGLPEGAKFPVLLTADSAGIKLRALVPAPETGRAGVKIDELTDSAAKSLGALVRPPLGIGPDALKGPLGEAKARLDSACRADSTKCPPRPRPDSLRPVPPVPPAHDSLRPVPPVPPAPDSLRPVPPVPPVDSLRPVPPAPPVDSLRPVPPAPPVDSLRPVPPAPPADSLRPRIGK